MRSNGGMPSSHTSTIVAATNSIGLTCGYGSPIFVLSLIFCLIVINDATNVRLETGKQAETMNRWSKAFEELLSPEFFKEEHFKTMVGHTKIQVLWGAITGLVVSFLLHFLFFS